MLVFKPMEVERIVYEHGSHIVPPLEDWWSDQDRLRWKASVVEHDTGVRVPRALLDQRHPSLAKVRRAGGQLLRRGSHLQ